MIGVVIYFTPVINMTIRWMQPAVLIMIPVGVAWVLTDVGTEDRSPMKFFKSFLRYNFQKIKGGYLYRNKEIEKLKSYSFGNYISYSTTDYSVEMGAVELSNANEDDNTFNSLLVNDKKESGLNKGKQKEVELVPINNSFDLTSYLFDNKSPNTSSVESESVAYDEPTNLSEEVDTIVLSEEVDTNELNEEETEVGQVEDEVTVPDKKLENKVVKMKRKRVRKKRNGDTSREKSKNKVVAQFTLIVTALLVSVGLIVGFLDTGKGKESSPNDILVDSNLDANKHEEHLLKGIKQSSVQNYKQAVIYFDEVDFSLLEKEDKEIVLLSYLFTDQIGKILELDSEFDEVVTSYYVAKENVSKLRQYEDRSDEFKFVLAIEDNKYQTIVDLKDKVFVDEERESVIVNAYIELEQMEEALIYAKSTDNESLISTVEEILDSKNDKEKENDDE